MLRVTNVRLAVGALEETLKSRCAQILRIPPADIPHLRILRKSLDIREKKRLEHVYTLAVELKDEEQILAKAHSKQVERFVPRHYEAPVSGQEGLSHRPVVIGAGPGGLFAAYVLAEHGYCPLVLERGQPVSQRIRDVADFDRGGPLDVESNYLYGEGGAGTFSDGKLTCRNTGPDTDRVLEIFAACKGKPSILYEARPHLGSNRLPAVVKALRQRIIAMGGEVRFHCRVDDIEIRNGQIQGVHTSEGYLPAEVVMLATGHSARDTYGMLLQRGVPIEAKAFQMGVRIEQPQSQVNVAQFGTSPQAKLLGPADYTMNCTVGTQEVFTFCMCAGGYVMPSVSQHEHFCTNGMSRSKHESPFANSGIVLTVDPKDLTKGGPIDPLIGVRYQASLENLAFRMTGGNYYAPIQRAEDFLAERASSVKPPSSYARGVHPVNLWELLPTELCQRVRDGLSIFDRRWHGLFLKNATIVAPETRGSCPVRIPRDTVTRESVGVAGLYPVGEGAGYAGGIVSAAVDGLRTAKAIITRYHPLAATSQAF